MSRKGLGKLGSRGTIAARFLVPVEVAHAQSDARQKSRLIKKRHTVTKGLAQQRAKRRHKNWS